MYVQSVPAERGRGSSSTRQTDPFGSRGQLDAVATIMAIVSSPLSHTSISPIRPVGMIYWKMACQPSPLDYHQPLFQTRSHAVQLAVRLACVIKAADHFRFGIDGLTARRAHN